MKSELVSDHAGPKVRVVILDSGEEAFATLTRFANEEKIAAASLTAIGDIAVEDDGKASLHVHIVLGLSDSSTRGGHFLAGKVRPTLEVILTEVPARLRRKKRADLGIALIDVEHG